MKYDIKLEYLKEAVFSGKGTRELFLKDLRPSTANFKLLDSLSGRLASLEKKFADDKKKAFKKESHQVS